MGVPIVREVWRYNLEQEVSEIMQCHPYHRFAAMDTEFPGRVFGVKGDGYSQLLSPYQLMKVNVDTTQIIQLGIALCDAEGESCRIWEFNFRDFDDRVDSQNPESIELLKSQGINFHKNRVLGINSLDFAKLILDSGLLCNPNITWVTFHGACDFGYFIRTLIRRQLPCELNDFMDLVKFFFGNRVFDVKCLIKFCDGVYGGLERVAKTLGVSRAAGKSHQAGSDSLLTLQTFMKLKEVHFGGKLRDDLQCVVHDLTERENKKRRGNGYLVIGSLPIHVDEKDQYCSLNRSLEVQACRVCPSVNV